MDEYAEGVHTPSSIMNLFKLILVMILAVAMAPAWAYRADNGRIYGDDGTPIQLRGTSWAGFDEITYLAPQGLWTRGFKDMIAQMKEVGINAVRLPFCPAALAGRTPGYIDPVKNPELQGLNSLEILDVVVAELDRQDMYVLLDHHRPDCAAISPLWYTDVYSEEAWIRDLVFVASRYRQVPHFLGLDIKNEPYGATWGTGNVATDWNLAAERAAAAVLEAAPHALIFVEGIRESAYCSSTTNHFWGENLEPLACRPLRIPADRLVISPHAYGPDVYPQPYFSDPGFPTNMPAIWEQHFGRFVDQGYTLVVGEFGGRYESGTADRVWQDAFVDYLIAKGLNEGFYWAWNPNNGDTGGLLQDDWVTVRGDKIALLRRLWDHRSPAPPAYLPVTDRTSLEWSLDLDGNCVAEAPRDGVLILRSLFGFGGETLIGDAVDPAGSRTSAESVLSYLGQMPSRLDVDANGSRDALTDGLLVLRFLSGMGGDDLVSGAVGRDAERRDASAIESYLAFQAADPCRFLRFSLAYGPYREGQAPDGNRPSAAQMVEDIAILAPQTDLIRTYGACAEELAEIAGLANGQGLRLWQGVDLGPMAVAENNDRELACLARLALAHGNVVAAIVGNELLRRGDPTEEEIAGYVQRAAATGLPVTTADTWTQWCNAEQGVCRRRPTLADAVDFIVAHAHPYWQAMPVEHAAATVVAEYIALRALYPGKPVVIGEAGWPSEGPAYGNAVPSLANQRRFIEELWRLSRLYAVPIVFFDAFDEPWKAASEGAVGGHWGMYRVDRSPKHTDLDWSLPQALPVPAGPMIGVDYPKSAQTLETKSDCGVPLFGRAYPGGPGWQVTAEVYTDQWYPQGLWYPGGRAPVVDGLWSMPQVVLAGTGIFNDHRVRVRLLNEQEEEVARDEITGLVRSNACSP